MVTKRSFGFLQDGTEVSCWLLKNDNLEAEVLDYGATIRSIRVPDQNGNPIDVVLGYDTIEEYVVNNGYMGATIGRFANRIAGGHFELNGKTYDLATNNGIHHSHGGIVGFNCVMWKAEEQSNGVLFSRLSADGEEGYPGNLKVSVTMRLLDNGLQIAYRAETDQDTILNLTNHTYFNLNGAGTVNDQKLTISAEKYTVADETCLPTGEIASVAGTALDFRTEKAIGRDADADEPCVKMTCGYDTNYILSGHPAVVARSEQSGIVMVMDTDQPGMQLYTANNMSPRKCKTNAVCAHRAAFCLETQHYPDCIHHSTWPSCILRKGEVFESVTSYCFSTKNNQ